MQVCVLCVRRIRLGNGALVRITGNLYISIIVPSVSNSEYMDCQRLPQISSGGKGHYSGIAELLDCAILFPQHSSSIPFTSGPKVERSKGDHKIQNVSATNGINIASAELACRRITVFVRQYLL